MDKNRDLRSHSLLTEFAPLSPEANEAGIGYQLLSKFFSFNKDAPPSSLGAASASGSPQSNTPTDAMSSRRGSDESIQSTTSTASTFPVNISEGRSLPNVLKRISNLLALKSNNLQAYKDTQFKQYWMPDSVSRECYDCEEKFTTFRRRHHCRICGQIFCSRCCNQEIPGKIMGCTGALRVCTYCCKVVLSYLQSVDMDAELTSDLRALQEDLQSKLAAAPPAPLLVPPPGAAPPPAAGRKLSLGSQQDTFALGRAPTAGVLGVDDRGGGLRKSASLRSLFQELRGAGGPPLQTHRFRLRNHRGCFLGSQLVEWLVAQGRAANREQGCAMGQALLEAGFLEAVGERGFTDGYTLYRPRDPGAAGANTHDLNELAGPESEWGLRGSARHDSSTSLSSSSSTFYLDLNVGDSTVHLSRPPASFPADSPGADVSPMESSTPGPQTGFPAVTGQDRDRAPATGWPNTANLRTDNGEQQAHAALCAAFDRHELALCKQLLDSEGLPQSWADVLLPICRHIVETVRPDPDALADQMDIRQYVHWKKVPGGRRSDSRVVSGLVCTKNVAHRAMAARLTNPRILLLGCSIVYQRVEGKLMAIERIVMQEREYLGHVVQRIAALAPDVVLVERAVSRLAQEALLALGVALALHVKPAVLARAARLTHADVAPSVDTHLAPPRLGTCRSFYLRAFPPHKGFAGKTLMFLEDCALPGLGCTVLLRGGPATELCRVKRVARHMLFARYNWRLEKSFLMDESARPPTPPNDGLFDDDASSTRSPARETSLSESPAGSLRSHLKHSASLDSASPPLASPASPLSSPSPGHALSPGPAPSAGMYVAAAGNSFVLMDSVADRFGGRAVGEGPEEADDSVFVDRPVSSVEASKEERRPGSEWVLDRSDPLHVYLHAEAAPEGEGPAGEGPEGMAVSEPRPANRFRKALDDVILSVSPFIKLTVPFLETEAGRKCVLRRFFPAQVFHSAQFLPRASVGAAGAEVAPAAAAAGHTPAGFFGEQLLPRHPFALSKMTLPADSEDVQTAVADFRARGGRISRSNGQRHVSVCEEPADSKVAAPSGADADGSLDALDPANHQALAVLFSSYSHHSQNAPAFCVSPWVVHMEFYGRNDISLGSFLERYCFCRSYACPSESCDAPMWAHVRRFVHGAGCVHVSLRPLDRAAAAAAPSATAPRRILVWSWCARCQQSSAAVPMSADTWSLSLTKYLELRFHAGAYKLRSGGGAPICPHSLHHDHYQYFALDDVVASFKYARIAVWEISLPPPLVESRYDPARRTSLIEEVKHLALQGYDVYSSVVEKLCALGNQVEGVAALKQLRTQEHAALKSCIEDVQLKLTSPAFQAVKVDGEAMDKEAVAALWEIQDAVVHLKVHVADAVSRWNTRIHEAGPGRRKDKQLPAATPPRLPDGAVTDTTADQDTATEPTDPAVLTPPTSSQSAADGSPKPTTPQIASDAPTSPPAEPAGPDCPESTRSSTSEEPAAVPAADPEPAAEPEPVPLPEPGSTLDTASEDVAEGKQSPATADRKSVKTLIMSQLRQTPSPNAAIQCPLNPLEHRLPTAGCLMPTLVFENEPSSIIAYALSSPDYRRALDDLHVEKYPAESAAPSPLSKRKSGSSLSDKLDSSSELLQSGESRRGTVRSFLRGNTISGSSPARTGVVDGTLPPSPPPPPPPPPPTSNATSETEATDEPREAKGVKAGPRLHVDVQFADGAAAFTCRVYLAEAFTAHRQRVLPAGEQAFLRSLARCVRWAARGGKSGSAFSKTRDDRFVLKELPRQELQLFLELAPHYLAYVARCQATTRPTLLGKILGVYRVGFRNGATNAALKCNLLVMENLFYARTVTHKFDLKGSVRNRLVDPDDDVIGDVVLLDENLLKMTCDSPLYMLSHSKSVLSQAIDNDTHFLASQEVMDYSLLVGLDQDRRELVVGIIDYIRTFTWDKKLETMVKSSGILGGQGKMPTVVSPELYRSRFIASMHQYFLPVPDRWAGLGKNTD